MGISTAVGAFFGGPPGALAGAKIGGGILLATELFLGTNWGDMLDRLVTGTKSFFGFGKPKASHRYGLGNVPFDDYSASLHRGEMVLPRGVANLLRESLSVGQSPLSTVPIW